MTRFIEIDGEHYEVTGCESCPCFDCGDSGYGAHCQHPLRTTEYRLQDGGIYREHMGGEFFSGYGFDDPDAFWEECPLKEVEE